MFVKVTDSTESVDDTVEIPVESEGFILMSTLIAQFPSACGLKFKNESSWRGLRVVEDKIYPAGEDKWNENTVYVVTFPKGNLFFFIARFFFLKVCIHFFGCREINFHYQFFFHFEN